MSLGTCGERFTFLDKRIGPPPTTNPKIAAVGSSAYVVWLDGEIYFRAVRVDGTDCIWTPSLDRSRPSFVWLQCFWCAGHRRRGDQQVMLLAGEDFLVNGLSPLLDPFHTIRRHGEILLVPIWIGWLPNKRRT